MISRFNLDQKRLNFYEDIEKFNDEFLSINSFSNKDEYEYIADKPSIIVNKDRTLKLSLIRNEKEFIYILFSNHSLSILPQERIKVHKATKEPTTFNLYSFKE